MKWTLLFTMCAAATAACGGADNKPAETVGTSNTTSSTPAPSKAPTGGDTMGPGATPTPAPATMPNDSSQTSPPMTNSGGASGSSMTTTPSDARVAQNPGGADQTSKADNTKINERDTKHGSGAGPAVTPMDQGNSGNETKITAAIRKSIVGDKSLSFNAKNVKVITTGTKVTLRGPVKSDQERASIEAIAKQTPGVTDVDNQLEVKK